MDSGRINKNKCSEWGVKKDACTGKIRMETPVAPMVCTGGGTTAAVDSAALHSGMAAAGGVCILRRVRRGAYGLPVWALRTAGWNISGRVSDQKPDFQSTWQSTGGRHPAFGLDHSMGCSWSGASHIPDLVGVLPPAASLRQHMVLLEIPEEQRSVN